MRRRQGLPKPHTPAQVQEIWANLEQGRWLGLLPWIKIVGYLPQHLAEFVEGWLQHPNQQPWRLDEVH
ncbi:MAG: hypothetical protein QGI86_16080 [Candidatus Poribacteria bacterium]|nr:hypothetical protein [Candidatus Poribacteria bacterium]MDP6748520.1 hypothetical protein [Candidatus Poribacteria bacterium]MDP6998605.1 hypothetical protein [Candidatus Poribacteria bacterium]